MDTNMVTVSVSFTVNAASALKKVPSNVVQVSPDILTWDQNEILSYSTRALSEMGEIEWLRY